MTRRVIKIWIPIWIQSFLGWIQSDSECESKNPDSDSRKKWVDKDSAGFRFEMPGFAHHWHSMYITSSNILLVVVFFFVNKLMYAEMSHLVHRSKLLVEEPGSDYGFGLRKFRVH